eukprot:767467-Rhodomonas_salina.1
MHVLSSAYAVLYPLHMLSSILCICCPLSNTHMLSSADSAYSGQGERVAVMIASLSSSQHPYAILYTRYPPSNIHTCYPSSNTHVLSSADQHVRRPG